MFLQSPPGPRVMLLEGANVGCFIGGPIARFIGGPIAPVIGDGFGGAYGVS